MKGHGEKLSRKQEVALAALLECETIAAAAERAGIGESTLWRWMRIPAFSEQYRVSRQQVLSSSIGALQKASERAVAALCRNLDCGSPGVEVSAARVLLDQAFKATELYDVLERVEVLEERLRQGGCRA